MFFFSSFLGMRRIRNKLMYSNKNKYIDFLIGIGTGYGLGIESNEEIKKCFFLNASNITNDFSNLFTKVKDSPYTNNSNLKE